MRYKNVFEVTKKCITAEESESNTSRILLKISFQYPVNYRRVIFFFIYKLHHDRLIVLRMGLESVKLLLSDGEVHLIFTISGQ